MHQSMEPLINDLRADDYGYRDLRWDGRGQSWDRVFRVGDLSKDFLAGAPWMLKAREIGATGVRVDIYDGLDNPWLSCEIVDGELFLQVDGKLHPFSNAVANKVFGRVFAAEIV